jgi:hypothetical protein
LNFAKFFLGNRRNTDFGLSLLEGIRLALLRLGLLLRLSASVFWGMVRARLRESCQLELAHPPEEVLGTFRRPCTFWHLPGRVALYKFLRRFGHPLTYVLLAP